MPVPEGGVGVFIIGAVYNDDNDHRQVKEIKDRHPSNKVVMLVDKYDLQEVLGAYRSGVDAYLIKSISFEVLLKTLDLVILGESVFPAAVLCSQSGKGTPADLRPSEILSNRELAILRCLMDGSPNKVIARQLDIVEATVKVHIKAILRKIRVKNRTQAAVWGMSHFALDEDPSANETSSS